MGREIRADYEQMFLLPPSLEDWVPADHPARFIRDFVDSLDLEAMGFRIPEADEGRPPYACDLLLKVWVYGYMNKIRHTRPLEAACREHMSLIWLTGANYPDHNTLWRFWAVNREALRGVFKRATWVAHKAGLVGLVVHALDGTKIAADVSRGKIWRRGELEKLLADLDAALEEIMGQTERAEGVEEGEYCLPPELRDKEGRRQKIREALAELDRAGRDYLHPVDADARLMRNGDGLGMAYNAQVVVDQQSGLIVAQDVVNEESDSGQLVSMLKATEDNLGVTASETLADAGYYAPGELAAAEEREMRVLVSMPREPDRRWNKGEFQKSNFNYDQKADVYTCPLGRELLYEETHRKGRGRYLVRAYRCRSAGDCPMREQCSRDKRGRKIERGGHEGAVERQRQKQQDSTKRELLKKRQAIAEPVFGQIKEQDGVRRFSLRGLENVKTQWAMICTAFDLRKLYRYWAAGALAIG